jgi:hypothetical protein
MLEVGHAGMSQKQGQAHFSMWSIMNAPLLAGNDLRTMDQETIDILTNPEGIYTYIYALFFLSMQIHIPVQMKTYHLVFIVCGPT